MLTIGASSDLKSLLASEIRRRTDSEFSHAWIVADLDNTFEAKWRVGYYPRAEYDDPNYRIFQVSVNVPLARRKRAFENLVKDYNGQVYGIGQALSIGWSLAWGRVGIKKKVKLTRGLVCSEVVWRYLNNMGGTIQRNLHAQIKDPNRCLPHELVKLWKMYPRAYPVRFKRHCD